ncbi:hypothetical protein RUM43_007129 [Polyplax serrata]|uniref:Uncharacterized protein n=1 Tax=Polyplax serrata TaxID=468196 RepID=A0AAN8P551_POLSC
MNSNWFSFDEDVASEFFERSKVERTKRNSGVNSKKTEMNSSWGHSSDVSDLLDLATSKCSFREKSKLLDSLLKERSIVRNAMSRASRVSDDPFRMRYIYGDDFFSDADEKITKIKNNFSSDRYETESQNSERKEEKFENKGRYLEKSSSTASANSYAFTELTNDAARSRKDSMDSSWSRKSCQGTVNFPASSTSTMSDQCGGYSAKSIGRSISRDSDDSVCTEKSINSSTISEKLPDGTDKTQIESNESWLRKSTSGTKIAEKKVNDMTMMEKNDDGMCEKSRTRMSYLEKSATGSSLQEEITSEKVTSSGKRGTKTIEQKTSSETFKKSHKTTPSKSSYYDDLDSCSFEHFVPSSFSKMCSETRSKAPSMKQKDLFLHGRSNAVPEKISKLIDEAVQQDDLFKIPSSLQTDIDKMTDDFFSSKTFGRDKTRTQRRLLTNLFSGTDKEESYATCSTMTKLKSENDSLQQENLKLQSIIQDVTAVNKRWQKYNNERRLYVQKLLSTIQDLQEQINLISEKSAFQSKSKEEIGSHHEEIERLKKEHQEHLAVLELQIKSHKDEWDNERKEKKKALQEKEEMQNRVHELMRDVNFLKEALQQERQHKNVVCINCKSSYDQNEIFQRMEFCPPRSPLKVQNCSESNCCTAVRASYNTVDHISILP